MSSRKQQSVLDEWHDVFVAVPWWVPLGVAAAAYIGLRGLPGFYPLAPYAAGVVVLIGVVAQISKYQRRALLARQTGLDSLRAMSWRGFELLVGEAYRQQQYNVEEHGGGGPDGGVDLILRRVGETTLVQCKQWKARQVGVSIVRELYGVMAAEKADAGIVVTVGAFTADAAEFAQGKTLHLVDGTQLLALVQQGQTPDKSMLPLQEIVQRASSASDVPSCPICQGTMVRRLARKGVNAGGEFWGCAAYPQCRGTHSL